jgi:hypothetical protein
MTSLKASKTGLLCRFAPRNDGGVDGHCGFDAEWAM